MRPPIKRVRFKVRRYRRREPLIIKKPLALLAGRARTYPIHRIWIRYWCRTYQHPGTRTAPATGA